MATMAEITNVRNISAVVFTPDGKHIVGGDEAGGIRRWSIEGTQQVGATMTVLGQVTAVAVSQDARWIVTGDRKGGVVVWNADTHQKALDIPCNSVVWAIDIASDSTRVAVGLDGSTAQIFNIKTGESLIPLLCHKFCVTGVKFSHTGHRIATATLRHSSVRVYNADTGENLLDISVLVQGYPITPLTWSPNDDKLFVVSPGKITCIDTSTSACSEWSIHSTEILASIVTNGRFIACSAASSVSLWDTVSHNQIGRTLGYSANIQSLALSPDDGYLACGNGNRISLRRLSDILPDTYLSPPASRLPLMEVSTTAIKVWKENDMKETEAILSEEISNPHPNHYVLANRALIRARSKQWNTALEDSSMSLQIKPSPIGHIAKALALIGTGEQESALVEFDFVFYVCNPNDVKFLCVLKAIVVFICGKHEEAILRVRGLIANADEETKSYIVQVLGNMYLKKGDYESAIQSFQALPRLPPPREETPQLSTISLIFGWNFNRLETVTWKRLCESLYASGRVKEVGETLVRMSDTLGEEEKESANCHILEDIVIRSRDVALLSWTGKSATYNSCLPTSPAVYTQTLYTPPILSSAEMEMCTTELMSIFPPMDHSSVVIYDRVTRLKPVRFINRRLHLPCLVFRVRSLSKNETNTYHANVTWLGDIAFTADEALALNQAKRLVFVHPWIRRLLGPHDHSPVTSDDESELDADVNSNECSGSDVGIGTETMHASLVEEAPPEPLDVYSRALQLIARLGQPFNALLLLKRPDGTYVRIASEHEIIVPGMGSNVPKDIRTEVLEVV